MIALLPFRFLALKLRDADGVTHVRHDFTHLHVEENAGITMVVVGEPIAIEDEVLVLAYQDRRSGTKKN